MVNPILLDKMEYLDFVGLADPMTGQPFSSAYQEGDISLTELDLERSTVVQCSDCFHIHLHKSWLENGNKCIVCSSNNTNENLITQSYKGKPEIISFLSSPDEFIEGNGVWLSWKVNNATKVFLNGDPVQAFGNRKIDIIDQATTFVLKAVNPRGLLLPNHKNEKLIILEASQPEVLYLGVDNEIIKEGHTTQISFKVRSTKHYKLVVDYKSNQIEIENGQVPSGYGEWEHHIQYKFLKPGTLYLVTSNAYKQIESTTIELTYNRVQFIQDLAIASTSSLIITKGTPVKITWLVENATRVNLSDGKTECNVEGTEFDYSHPFDEDFTLQLVAFGDFGQKVYSNKLQIRTARITNFRSWSNFDLNDPKFYLAWEGNYIDRTELSPPPVLDRRLQDSEEKIEILPSDIPIEYTLTAWPVRGEKIIKKVLILYPSVIRNFKLIGGEAILGTSAKLYWEVENARQINIEGLARELSGSSYTFWVSEEHLNLTLTVWGDTNVAQSYLKITIFKPPKIHDLRLPHLKIKIQFDFSSLQIPAFPFFGSATVIQSGIGAKHRYKYLQKKIRLIFILSEILLKLRQDWRQAQIRRRGLVAPANFVTKWRSKILNSTFYLRSKIRELTKSKTNE